MSSKSSQCKSFGAALVAVVLAFGASTACAGNVNVNINVGVPAPQVVVPAPVVYPPPAVSIEQDVDFVYPAALGFYVAVGVPYDLFYVQNSYYLCRDGRWFRARGSRGPWSAMSHRELPPGLRRHKMERIRSYRTAEYDVYRRDRDHYRGRHFRTAREEWKEQRKAEKEYRKEERREEKQYRKEAKHDEKDYRKEMKRDEKEQRKWEKEERKHNKRDND